MNSVNRSLGISQYGATVSGNVGSGLDGVGFMVCLQRS